MSISLRCDYCGRKAVFQESSAHIYNGRNYGPVYECAPCGAWVGCHKGAHQPLGRLANAALREAKKAAHAAFDPIWRARYERKYAVDHTYKQGMARGGRYKRLAELMGIPREKCHIGMFDLEQCHQAVEICKSGALEA